MSQLLGLPNERTYSLIALKINKDEIEDIITLAHIILTKVYMLLKSIAETS